MKIYLHCEGIKDYSVIHPLMKKILKNQEFSLDWIKRDTLKKWKMYRKKILLFLKTIRCLQRLRVLR